MIITKPNSFPPDCNEIISRLFMDGLISAADTSKELDPVFALAIETLYREIEEGRDQRIEDLREKLRDWANEL